MAKAKRKKRNVPWLPLIKFHQEILSQSEDAFFSFDPDHCKSQLWTMLPGFQPDRFAGPWEISDDHFSSDQFRQAIDPGNKTDEGNNTRLYLGGPHLIFDDRCWPILYREVEYVVEDDRALLQPADGTWSLSPVLNKIAEKFKFASEQSLDELCRMAIEKAAKRTREDDSVALSDAFITAVTDAIDHTQIKNVLNSTRIQGDSNAPLSRWLLFAPTGTASNYNQHLMADYQQIISRLETNGKDIGGLKLLENRYSGKSSEKDILDLIPLNEKQEKAARQILDGDWLSVISGPPGTGKSQVVVSVLLNAWAEGKSVLFASTNNKAVDVVRERVEAFEEEFPIVVRAGNRKFQNICEVLTRTLNMASDQDVSKTDAKKKLKSKERRKEQLRAELRSLKADLDSKVPQRINESRKAALESYARLTESRAEISSQQSRLDDERIKLGLIDCPVRKLDDWFCRLEKWLLAVPGVEEQIAIDEKERLAAVKEVAVCETARNLATQKLGLSSKAAGDWNWLNGVTASVELGKWLTRCKNLLSQNPEDDLDFDDWNDEFNRWQGSLEAEQWKLDAEIFLENAHDTLIALQPLVDQQLELEKDKASAQAEIQAENLPIEVSVSVQLMEHWEETFAALEARPRHFFDFLPWSEATILRRRLMTHEKRICRDLPPAAWQALVPFDDTNRYRLAEHLSLIKHWYASCQKFEDTASSRERIDREFNALESRVSGLEIPEPPLTRDLNKWDQFMVASKRQIEVASRAAEFWKKREKKSATEKKMRNLSTQWKNLAPRFMLKELWESGEGLSFVTLIHGLRDKPSANLVDELRQYISAGGLQELREAWNACENAQLSVAKASQQVGEIPIASVRIKDCFKKRPGGAGGGQRYRPDKRHWPNFSELQTELNGVRIYIQSANDFEGSIKPRLEADVKQEYGWSVERLQEIEVILIESSEKHGKEFSKLIGPIKKNPDHKWSPKDINKFLTRFSLEAIHSRIDEINAKLKSISFEVAKSRWLAQLGSDEESVQAVDNLERLVKNGSPSLDSEYAEIFKAALRSVPVWITTAQSSKVFPIEPNLFDLVVIDEASQCTLTNILPLIYRAKRFAVIGDVNQLPAIAVVKQESTQDTLAAHHGVQDQMELFGHYHKNGHSVYDTACRSLPKLRGSVIHLDMHFRSHPQIIGFVNRYIYQQRLKLQKDPEVYAALSARGKLYPGVMPIPVSGNAIQVGGSSWRNAPEAERVVKGVKYLRDSDGPRLHIGIVTPYIAQRDLIKNLLVSERLDDGILVDTADAFQGDEREVIFFSPVASDGMKPGSFKWLNEPPNRINVAITRARELLFVVADIDYCARQQGILRDLALYCKDIRKLDSEAERELFSWMMVQNWNPEVHPLLEGRLEPDFSLKKQSGQRLYIEVDGGQHDDTQEEDAGRDALIRAQGHDVMRISARRVLETPFAVINEIEKRLND